MKRFGRFVLDAITAVSLLLCGLTVLLWLRGYHAMDDAYISLWRNGPLLAICSDFGYVDLECFSTYPGRPTCGHVAYAQPAGRLDYDDAEQSDFDRVMPDLDRVSPRMRAEEWVGRSARYQRADFFFLLKPDGEPRWLGGAQPDNFARPRASLRRSPTRGLVLTLRDEYLAALFAALPLVRYFTWLGRRWRRGRADAPRLCVKCGYDLRATPEQCPECGLETRVAS